MRVTTFPVALITFSTVVASLFIVHADTMPPAFLDEKLPRAEADEAELPEQTKHRSYRNVRPDRFQPLDLPSGGRGSDDEDEDPPEIIDLWGTQIEGDGFVFLIASKTPWAYESNFELLKSELKFAIRQLSRRAEFTIVGFETNGHEEDHPIAVWSETSRRATRQAKAKANQWLDTLHDSDSDFDNGYFCITDAAIKTIRLAKNIQRRHVSIAFLVNFRALCVYTQPDDTDDSTERILDAVTDENSGEFPIHVFLAPNEYLLSRPGWLDSAHKSWRNLADRNDGTFTDGDQ